MKKIFILLTSMFLLVGCIESFAVLGGGASNGKLVQSSFNTGVSFGVKKTTGRTPLGHALSYVQKIDNNNNNSCSSFANKKDLEICLMVEKRIISKQPETKEEKFIDRPSKKIFSSLQSSINKKFKIQYLD